jgi:hypothetical protein
MIGDNLVAQVGKDTLLLSYKARHGHHGYMAEYLQARAVILQSLAGNDPLFASWF